MDRQRKREAAGSEVMNQIFVGRLNSNIEEIDLKNHFGQYGQVRSANIKRHPDGKTRGFGFVSFDSTYAVDAVLKDAYNHWINDVQVGVRLAENRRAESGWVGNKTTQGATIWVKGIPSDIGQADLENYFGPYGAISDFTFPKNSDDTHRGYCYITFENPSNADDVIGENPHTIGSESVEVVRPEGEGSFRDDRDPREHDRRTQRQASERFDRFMGGGSSWGGYGRGKGGQDMTQVMSQMMQMIEMMPAHRSSKIL